MQLDRRIVSMMSETSLLMHTQMSIINFFEREFNNQFNNVIITTKLPKRQIKGSQYSEAVTESHISIMSLLSKPL